MKTTRRFALIGSAACTAFAGLAGMAGTEADPVIAVARKWFDCQCEYIAAEKRMNAALDARDDAAEASIDAEIEAILDRQHEALVEILDTPARSLVGIRAKMRIAAIYITIGNGPDDLNQEDRLTLSALADAERLVDG